MFTNHLSDYNSIHIISHIKTGGTKKCLSGYHH